MENNILQPLAVIGVFEMLALNSVSVSPMTLTMIVTAPTPSETEYDPVENPTSIAERAETE